MTVSGCTDRHTPQDAHGQPLPGVGFAGGFILDGPCGRPASTNITPDLRSRAKGLQPVSSGEVMKLDSFDLREFQNNVCSLP